MTSRRNTLSPREFAVRAGYQIPGMLWPQEAGQLYDLFAGSSCHVEIGSYAGKSLFTTAMTLAEGAVLYAVDPFILSDIDTYPLPSPTWLQMVQKVTIEDIRHHRKDLIVSQVELTGFEFARKYHASSPQPTTIYIDGSHYDADVDADINSWLPLLAKGGIMAGHDFWPQHPGVMDAVSRNLPGFKTFPNSRIWYYTKT